MTIKNPNAYIASLWDWACLDGCFGDSKIHPSDLDGCVERKGFFLGMETKLPGVVNTQGQEIMYNKLAKEKEFLVLLIWGHPGKPEKIELRWKNIVKIYDPANLETLREIVSNWHSWANNGGINEKNVDQD